MQRVLCVPCQVIGEFFFGSSPVRGELIGVPCLPSETPITACGALVEQAAALAVDRGSNVVGLGALTAPATGGGRRLLPRIGHRATITTGNTLTAAVARRNALQAAEVLGLGRRARVAVLGCTGSVGQAASRLLAEDGFDLTLIGRNERQVRNRLPDLASRATVSGNLTDIAAADVVLVLTSDRSARLNPGIFASLVRDRIVIDLAEPANVVAPDLPQYAAVGVSVANGGLVEVPGFQSTHNLRLPAQGVFACLTETYLFAREGLRSHAVGAANPEQALRLERVAERHGVHVRPLEWLPEKSPAPLALRQRQA